MKTEKIIENMSERDMQRFGMALSNCLEGKVENLVVNMEIIGNILLVEMWSGTSQIAEFEVNSLGLCNYAKLPKILTEEMINSVWHVFENKKLRFSKSLSLSVGA